jgi:hypothetical protein
MRNVVNVTLATNGMLVGVGRDALTWFQVPYPECLFGSSTMFSCSWAGSVTTPCYVNLHCITMQPWTWTHTHTQTQIKHSNDWLRARDCGLILVKDKAVSALTQNSYRICVLPSFLPNSYQGNVAISPYLFIRWNLRCYCYNYYYGSTALCWALAASSVSWSYTQSVGILGRMISPSQFLYLHAEQHKQNKRTQTSMHRVGLEPMIPVFQRAKTVHALDRAATVIQETVITHNLSYSCLVGLESVNDSLLIM